jgi:hypothetical protein
VAKLSIESQISEMEYVCAQMRKWHAHEVNARHTKRDVADLHEAHQIQILDTLRWFEKQEGFIRTMFALRTNPATKAKIEQLELELKEATDAESAT